MRYVVFSLFILLNSCTLFRHQPEQEKIATTEPLRTTTVPVTTVAESKPVIDTIPGAIVFDPSLITATSSNIYPWTYSGVTSYYGEYLAASYYPQLFLTSIVSAATIDSVHIQPGEETFEHISPVPVKPVAKSSAAILPDPKSSLIPYIVCGIAAVFLSTLLFAFIRRKNGVRKTK